MTDPLSITASIVSITVPALHGIRLLLQDLQQLKDAPRTLQDLADDVRSVETAIQLLEAVEETEWAHLGTAIAEGSKATISSASKACGYFRNELQKWTKHSQGRKITLQDRATVGFLKKDEVKCCGVCSEAKDQVEQLSIIKSVLLYLFCCVVLFVVAISLVAIDVICLHDVSLMYTCVESAHGVEGGALGQRTWYT
jgi:hypothetical protein